MIKIDWKGIYPAITTQFNKDGSLDLVTFGKNLQVLFDAGIHGVVLGGTLGEASTLAESEKLQLLETTLNIVGDKIPVLINIAEKTTRAAIKSAEGARRNGASGLMILPPMQYKADERETICYFKAVAESTDLPIMIYNNPVDYGIEVTEEMFQVLLEYDNIQAVKESTRDLTNVTRLINRFGDRLNVLCGIDTLALEAMLMGASGWVAGLVSAFPRETVAIYELAKAGQIEEAREIYRWFMPLLELDINSKLVQNIKLAGSVTGLGTEYVRKPRLPLVGKEREQVKKIISISLKRRPNIPNIDELTL